MWGRPPEIREEVLLRGNADGTIDEIRLDPDTFEPIDSPANLSFTLTREEMPGNPLDFLFQPQITQYDAEKYGTAIIVSDATIKKASINKAKENRWLLNNLFWTGVIHQVVLILALWTFSPAYAAGSVYTLLCLFVWRWMYQAREVQ